MKPTTPTNIIFTGVAGTGKTYQLQQIAKDYTEYLPTASHDEILQKLVEPLSWREVICLVFLDEMQKGRNLLKVSEILANPFFITKANANERVDNLSQTAWSTLQQFSNPNSQTINYKNRSSQAFFDKDDSSNWFLLDESLPILTDLQTQLKDYQTAINNQFQPKTERFSFVSFHQAYGYEEFVEGIRPKIADNGQMTYSVEQGAFLKLCERAKDDPNHRYAMLIDEINRANVARVFGELMSLIEPSKRVGQANALSVNLAYSHKPFSVPSNVDIYATMNTQDHSLTPLDMAFRRRFNFVECEPKPELLGKILANNIEINLLDILINLNNKITQMLSKDSRLGHSFLWDIYSLDELATAFEQMILPQVSQSCQNNGQILQNIFGKDLIVFNDNQNMSVNFGINSQLQNFVVNTDVLYQVDFYQNL